MITVVATDADLEALGPEWNELWSRCKEATPFQSPNWLLPWWHQFGTGMPRVVTSRRYGQLVGVLPLYIFPEDAKALPIGAGTTDYLDALGDPAGLLDAALMAIDADAIRACDLIDINPRSALIETSAPGWSTAWQQSSACPVLTLPKVPKLAQRKLRMNRNRAERAGGWNVVTADSETVQDDVAVLARLHQARWAARGTPGVLSDPRILDFWREAAPCLLSAGLLRLQRLQIGQKVAAVLAALLAPNRIFFYLSGFDEAYAAVSPGSMLLGSMLEQAIAEGRSEAHFLRGQENYKYGWGAVDRFNWSAQFRREPDSVALAASHLLHPTQR